MDTEKKAQPSATSQEAVISSSYLDESSQHAKEAGESRTNEGLVTYLGKPPLRGLDINLIPAEITMPLRCAPKEPVSAGERPLWHYVEPPPGVLVSVWSQNIRPRLARLSVRGLSSDWNPRWIHWAFAIRRVPDDLGGEAVSAQDQLSEDETELTLLLLPGEQRSVTLEFIVELDGQSAPGDYEFDVVLADMEDGAYITVPGMLRLRHPEASLLNYLPAIYRQPVEGNGLGGFVGRPFFERYLRGFEEAMEPTNRILDHIDRYFDADMAPADFLPWLSTWVSLSQDENWPQLKRRRLILEAAELYRWRGTRRGLARYLEIYTGVTPTINDHPFEGMKLGPETRLGQDTRLGHVPPHSFVITLAVPDPRTIDKRIIHRIIESNKPAHTAYRLQIVESEAGAPRED